MTFFDIIVCGGGAAGFFAALAAKSTSPHLKVAIFEKMAALLAKVRVSGGGRCNVTHACFDPLQLSKNYPRGGKELIGPFHTFQPRDTIRWFQERGITLKTETDGRMFPVTDSSETIIHALLGEAKRLGVEIHTQKRLHHFEKKEDGFHLDDCVAKKVILATGSSKEGYAWAQACGHTIQNPIPSLFTFNIPSSPFKEISGLSLPSVRIHLKDHPSFFQTAPFLFTHFGFSGPAVLKLSAWAAPVFHAAHYHLDIIVNWLPSLSEEQIFTTLTSWKEKNGAKILSSENPFYLPKNFWKILTNTSSVKWINLPSKALRLLAQKLHRDIYTVEGKTTNKEEFVTCGGVTLKEVDFRSLQSKRCPGLFFAGEILDIDGVTGGFNFQNAWTTGFIAGTNAATI